MRENLQKLAFSLFPFILPLPLPLKYSSIALILFCLTLLSSRENKFEQSYKTPFVIVFLMFFLTDTLGNILRFNTDSPFFQDIKLSFLLVPIIFVSNATIIKKYINIILYSFVLGTIGYCLYAWWFVFDFYFITAPGYRPFSFGDHYIAYMLYNYLPNATHHTYIGIYIIFSIFILIYKMTTSKKHFFLKTTGILILFFSLFYIGGKSSFLLLFILTFIYLISIKKASINISFIFLFAGGLYLVKERIMGLSLEHSVFYRLNYYKCGLEIISNHWFSGIGSENFSNISKLLCNNDVFIPHNMFLRAFVTNGVFSFFILLTLSFIVFLDALKSKNLLYTSLILILIIGGMTEDLLYLQRGTLFFVFFILIFHTINKKSLSTS